MTRGDERVLSLLVGCDELRGKLLVSLDLLGSQSRNGKRIGFDCLPETGARGLHFFHIIGKFSYVFDGDV